MERYALVVDDSQTMRDMVSYTLRQAEFEVVEAVDGKDGLEQAGCSRFDIIIVDVNMPIMDGITLTEELRKMGQLRGVPILILTTESDVELKKRGRAAGATGWIIKPFKPEKLLQIVEKVCGEAEYC